MVHNHVGRGIGPLAILQCDKAAPQDLRDRALMLAGHVLEFSKEIKPGTGKQTATELLDTGKAWQKFQAICKAQGGLFEPPIASFIQEITAKNSGKVSFIDNRLIARVAKLAGAPKSKAAGIEFLSPLGTKVEKGQPLFVIHAETQGELKYALAFLEQEPDIVQIEVI